MKVLCDISSVCAFLCCDAVARVQASSNQGGGGSLGKEGKTSRQDGGGGGERGGGQSLQALSIDPTEHMIANVVSRR